MLWKIVGGLAALLPMFGFVPQCLKMWNTKSAKGVNRVTLLGYRPRVCV